MDTSETYIKLCQKAERIQEDKQQYDMGSWFWEPNMREICILIYPHNKVQYGWEKPWYEQTLVAISNHDLYAKDHHAIWLPRQDQLQAMLMPEGTRGFLFLLDNFTGFVWPDAGGVDLNYVDSMEKLWLAFVMHKKYHKTWNGEEWITLKLI